MLKRESVGVGKQAVGACKTETCKTERDYRTTEQQRSIRLNYSTVKYSSSNVLSSPLLLDTHHQHTWLFCILGDGMSMCHWGHHPVQATFAIRSYLSFDKGQKDMREMLCTLTVCPQSLGESCSWGWDRKLMTPGFSSGTFPSLLSGASHTASPQVWQRSLGIGKGINLSHAKAVYRVQWWLLLFVHLQLPLFQLLTDMHCISLHFTGSVWISDKRSRICPLSTSHWKYPFTTQLSELEGFLEFSKGQLVLMWSFAAMKIWVTWRKIFFSSFSFALSSKRGTGRTVYQPLSSPQWNSTTPSDYHTMLHVLRAILCRNILQ